MIPLMIAEENKELKIFKITADDKTRKHLENLGILKDSIVTIISKNSGNVILKVKDGRLALNKDLVSKIFVD